MSLFPFRVISVFFISWFLSQCLFAQVDDDWRLYKPKTESNGQNMVITPHREFGNYTLSGQIDFIVDSRIKNLDELKIEHPSKQDGYRVQIYFGNRDTAREKRSEFLSNYPHHSAYISYLAPNFRLRVGDFRTRLESEKFKNEIARNYPGSYIVKDKIELPPLEAATMDLEASPSGSHKD